MATNASGRTPNYGLSQWLESDDFRMEDFNADNLAIDAAIASSHKLNTGSYAGTGTYGVANPCSLTFDFVPALVIIEARETSSAAGWYGGPEPNIMIAFLQSEVPHAFLYGVTSTNNLYAPMITLSGTTMSWAYYSIAAYQLNDANYTYDYVAIG